MKLATLCYVKQNGKTLMLRRSVKKLHEEHEGNWNGLGGKFQAGETPEECVIREVKEESGLAITKPQYKGLLTFPAFDNVEEFRVFVFTATEFEGTPTGSDEGTVEWIDDSNIDKLHLWDADRIFLKWLDQPGIFSAKFQYENGKVKSHSVEFYK